MSPPYIGGFVYQDAIFGITLLDGVILFYGNGCVPWGNGV